MQNSRLVALAVVLVVLACSDPGAVGPTSPPTRPLPARSCALGLSDADAIAIINDLIAEVNSLESNGTLSSGQASALRSHLESILQSIAAGNYCAAAAQLQAYRQLVANLVRGGVLTEDQGDDLSDGASDVLEGPKDELAFVTDRDGNWEIYKVKSDGSDLRNLTNNAADDARYRFRGWSPDGSKIVFATYRDGVAGIFVMNADGSNLTRLTTVAGGWDNDPVWSPDGQRIAFGREQGTGTYDLWVMNTNGSDQQRLTNTPESELSHDWSPDGSRLVFQRGFVGNDWRIHVIDRDGSGDSQLTVAVGFFAGNPVWSPDGTRIAFVSASLGTEQLYTINPDGSGTTLLTTPPAPQISMEPAWSPDGTTLAFTRCPNLSGCQIYTIRNDGTGETNVSNDGSVSEVSPVWSPDGTRLAFSRLSASPPLRRDIYIMNRDGTGKRSITNSTGDNFDVVWRPRSP
jgi:Tol biopolymer transport system component